MGVGSGLPSQNFEVGKVCIKNICFLVEIPETRAQMEYGLMNREHLDSDKGMLFIFEKDGEYPFCMKNTLLPLDIIWINSNQSIVYIKKNAQPCTQDYCPSIYPRENARYVLEINGGLCDKYGINVGDKVNISYMPISNPRENFLTRKTCNNFATYFERLIWF
jgi:uncharacterized membrane protein (UPF0127 family)